MNLKPEVNGASSDCGGVRAVQRVSLTTRVGTLANPQGERAGLVCVLVQRQR